MTIQPDEAARALQDAEAAAERSVAAVNYQHASSFLILWGLVWVAGNVAAYFRMPYGSYAFPALMLTGVVGSFVLGMRGGLRRHSALRSLVIAASIAMFSMGVQLVADITSLATAEAIIGLAVGAAYMVLGLSTGWRLTAVGAATMIAIMVGWIYAREQFFLWMAFVSGGGLILGGLWLRKI